jgi:hypothetical protein
MRCSKYGMLIWGLYVANRRVMGTARHFCEGLWVGGFKGREFPGKWVAAYTNSDFLKAAL